MTAQWTTPTYGVQHLGKHGDRRWATVTDYGTFALLLQWYQGCGFDPHEERHPSAAAARAAGERWVTQP